MGFTVTNATNIFFCAFDTLCQVWEATVSSSSAAGIRVADVDGDGFMEAVVATFDG